MIPPLSILTSVGNLGYTRVGPSVSDAEVKSGGGEGVF